MPLVGVIANPASGRDIRRITAQGTIFDNNEKVALVRRVLLGLDAVGITHVVYMPEYDFGIVPRAADGQPLTLEIMPLDMPVLRTSADSTHAAKLLMEANAGCIITLGGDGTNRAVAKGCGSVPLVPISTGTNNVFPQFLEGTLAGIAAGLIATGRAGGHTLHRKPWLEVLVDGVSRDVALVDVAVSSRPFLGARAIWNLSEIREIALSQVIPGTIGLSSLGGALLAQEAMGEGMGLHIVIGKGGKKYLAPLAPGLVTWVGVSGYRWLATDDLVWFEPGVGTVALDGEREIELSAETMVGVRLRSDGVFVVDVPAALAAAARAGHLQQEQIAE